MTNKRKFFMQIIKRNGIAESYDKEKIATAIRKSFASTGQVVEEELIYSIVTEVERSLMEHGYYAEAKSYILYHWQRTEQRNLLQRLVEGVDDVSIAVILKEIQQDFLQEIYGPKLLVEKFAGFMKRDMNGEEQLTAFIKVAVELTTQEAPD